MFRSLSHLESLGKENYENLVVAASTSLGVTVPRQRSGESARDGNCLPTFLGCFG